MSKKMVEGHASKQAPASRSLVFVDIVYRRPGCVGFTSNLQRAVKWYENGNAVQVVERRQAFKLVRGTAAVNYSGITETVYTEWHKKSGKTIDTKHLNHIARVNAQNDHGNGRMVCTF